MRKISFKPPPPPQKKARRTKQQRFPGKVTGLNMYQKLKRSELNMDAKDAFQYLNAQWKNEPPEVKQRYQEIAKSETQRKIQHFQKMQANEKYLQAQHQHQQHQQHQQH